MNGSIGYAANMPVTSRQAILYPLHSNFDVWNKTVQPITLTYSFISTPPTVGGWVPVQFAALPDLTLQQVVRNGFQEISDAVLINFVELPYNSADTADIRIISGSYAGTLGYTQTYWSLLSGWKELDSLVIIYAGSDFTSAHGRNLVLHELGHALTMKHSGNYDSSGANIPGPFLPAMQDNGMYTVQSYNKHPFINQERDSLGIYDIGALQYRWGTNYLTRIDDTTYNSFNGKNSLAIWDAGGEDTIDFRTNFNNMEVILQDGGFSSIWHPFDLSIAYGVTIENAVGGYGHDKIYGNTVDNRLTGGPGNDTIDGGTGVDTAVFSGPRAQHIVNVHRAIGGGVISVTVGGNEGLDYLTNVEFLEFADGRFSVRDIINDDAPLGGLTSIFRFFNHISKTHFYTANPVERDHLLAGMSGQSFGFEGKVFSAPDSGTSVWRFYNEHSGTHFYTIDTQERDQIRAKLSYMLFEGEAYKAGDEAAAGTSPLHRFYNTQTGSHFFTADGSEMASIRANLPQYQYEGIAYYII